MEPNLVNKMESLTLEEKKEEVETYTKDMFELETTVGKKEELQI